MFQVGDIVTYIDDLDGFHYLVTKIDRHKGIELLCLEDGRTTWDTYKAMDCYEIYA